MPPKATNAAARNAALLARQKEFTGYLVAGFPDLSLKGLPLKSACAITGNASVENQAKPVTTGPKDHGSDGILQWRLSRLDGPHGLKGWSQAHGLDWATLRTQAAFTLWELHRDYSDYLEKILREGKKPIDELTEAFCRIYERPNMAVAGLDLRQRHARSVYKIMSDEQKVSLPAKIGAGAAVIVGGAGTAAAHAAGADDIWTALAGLATLVVSGGIPVISQWLKSRATPAPAPAPEPAPAHEIDDDIAAIQPIELYVSPTVALDAALSHARACKIELDNALADVAKERGKVKDRLETLRAAVTAAESEAVLLKNSAALPVAKTETAEPVEYQGA